MTFVKPTPDYATFCQDVERTASLINTPCDMELVRAIFSTYWEYCESGWLSFRTTTKPNPDLSVRYIDVNIPHNPYAIALQHGFLTETGHPIEKIVDELSAHYLIQGYGVDMTTAYGIEKIWPLPYVAVPVEALYDMKSLPASMRNYDDYFKKYDLKWTSVYAIDYRHKSFNIYFMFPEPGHFTTQKVANMISDLGFEVPPEDELAVDMRVGALYYTFNWDSPRCERISFAVQHQPASNFPMEWSPVLARLMREAPTLLPEIRGSAQTAYSSRGNYQKVEVDYSGMEYSMVAAIEALFRAAAV